MIPFNLLTIFLLGVVLLLAVGTDQRYHRIPNWLSGTALLGGLLVQTLGSGVDGLLAGLSGILVGFSVFVIPYLRKSMAAGDVKLMAAVGAYLGPWLTFQAALVAMIAGAVLGLTLLTYRSYRDSSATVNQMLSARFPYASAIAIGTAAALILKELQWKL